MTDDLSGRSGYQVSSSLLAKKGNAEPLTKSAISLILANEKHLLPTDDQHLTDTVIDATLDLLSEPSGGIKKKATASLTDLLNPTLINVLRRT